MAQTSTKVERDLLSLKATVENVSSLIAQLLVSVKAGSRPNAQKPLEVNAIDLAHDAATLLKAHSTKLSLLIINAPFTPTAIMSVLREVSSGPLPALATSVELCDPEIFTKVMRSELQWRAQKALLEFKGLVGEIPLGGKVLSNERKNGTVAGMGKGSLAATGVVWAACDEVVGLKRLGIGGLMIQKVEQYRDTVKDALEELQEWGEEISESEEEDDELHDAAVNGNGTCNAAQDAIDDMFQDQRHIPANDVDHVRERLEFTLRRLKLIILLYQAIIKRRLKTFLTMSPPSTSSITRLDTLMKLLSRIPDSVDNIASAFYALDDPEISAQMVECFSTASAAGQVLDRDWDSKMDDFSAWSEKFAKAMAEGW